MNHQKDQGAFWTGLLGRHKFPAAIWLLFNVLLAAIGIASAMSVVDSAYLPTGSVKEREFVVFVLLLAILWVYLYGFVYMTDVLTSHVSLSRDINGLTPLVMPTWLEELTERVLGATPGFLLAIPLFYWFGYVMISAGFWLLEGRFPTLAACDLFSMICGWEIKAKGLAQLVRYVGENNLGLLLLLICIPGFCLTSRVLESREVE